MNNMNAYTKTVTMIIPRFSIGFWKIYFETVTDLLDKPLNKAVAQLE